MKLFLRVIAFALFAVSLANAQIKFSNVLGNNMVLQRAPQSSAVWGTANPNDAIKLSFNNVIYETTSNAKGEWIVELVPTEQGGPYTISVTSSKSGQASLTNVLFGDVYFCSGQSNMYFTVNMGFNNTQEIADAKNYQQIRLFSVGMGNASTVPLSQLGKIDEGWSLPTSSTMGTDTFFSAACWFFAKNLAQKFPGLPFGLISSNWGGTIVQAWSSKVALQTCNITDADTQRFIQQNNLQANCNGNTVLWNSMVIPFLNFAIKGALWYQGESNVGQPDVYKCAFPAMITDWRKNFRGGSEFPFFFVQLAPWVAGSGTGVPDIRQAQLSALALPNVGFASVIDKGDPSAPLGSIHPRDKQDVGSRLARAALKIAYSVANVNYLSPIERSVSVQTSDASVTYTVNFDLQADDYLTTKTATCPSGVSADNCQNFAVLLSDGKWYATTNATVVGTSGIRVTLAKTSASLTPRGLRYGYSSWPVATLYNSQDLPVIPFSYT